MKEHNYTGTENPTLIGSNDEVVDFYAQLDEKDIEFAGTVDIKSVEIEELIPLPSIGKKQQKKI